MKPHLISYSPQDLKISRTNKSIPRIRGDGEESENLHTTSIDSTTSELSTVSEKTIFQKDVYPLEEQTFTSFSKNRIPSVRNVAKVSIFSKPQSFILTPIPEDIVYREKVVLKPVVVYKEDKVKSLHSKRREPKFVPYEPYKCCINPILKNSNTNSKIREIIASRAKPQLLTLVQKEIPAGSNFQDDEVPVMIQDFEKERCKWESKNDTLFEENETLKTQVTLLQKEITSLNQHLSTQSQVNNELKKLLVASIGEDVQGRVQCLTEDKARMATMIRKYSERVDKDFEEKEKISIQCDVWRSKFLASSLLIDELAQWKGILFQKLEETKEALRLVLEERDVIHPYLLNAYKMIYQVQEAFDPLHAESTGVGNLDSCDIVSLSSTCNTLAENVRDRLLGSIGRSLGCSDIWIPDETRTPGEKIAIQVLDECIELCSQKLSLTLHPDRSALAHRFHPHVRYEHLTMNCCGHCNGEIKVV